jgi:hypothetical protein
MGKKGVKREDVLADVSNKPAEGDSRRAKAAEKPAQQAMVTFSRKNRATTAVNLAQYCTMP